MMSNECLNQMCCPSSCMYPTQSYIAPTQCCMPSTQCCMTPSQCCMNCCCCCCHCNNVGTPPPSNGETSGDWGPLHWEINYNIDPSDIYKDSFKIKITLSGVSIVDTELDAQHPKLNINLTISGVGIIGELGVDFVNRLVYLKGNLNFIFYQKAFNLVLLRF
ncbi:hypothetical protein [Clostridium botulinum]|uniref:hypothetical protein n=1 Tax=Clostridium botulinum TaxID=1491 RepID=UPI0002F5A0B6|nr:hypothetical protein [Clostridium botulinum]KLU75268.1 hypothetical protein CBC3_09760 [Clostridium botulinum V891]KOA78484.1 hypothetical protein ADU78_01800 [Clostridium botulinum]KOA91549.1 hypothetical protein ADU76_10930 [Clostridium botulinum]MCD3203711.1 hypothetical protein [Clostridium botulinum C/D]MCD3221909.1 hypothetical protein [Clostridium botulinum C/D]